MFTATQERPEMALLRPGQARTGQKPAFLSEKLLSRREVMAELGIGYRTFTRMRTNGEGPAVVWIGGRQMFAESELRRWIGAYTERPGQPYKVLGNAGC